MTPGGPTALVVDDDDGIRSLVAAILGRAGYVVQAVAGPLEAMRAVEVSQPDVYVLDVRLPDMSGHELCRVLKTVASTSRPVLMMSAESSPSDVARAFQAGCDAFLAKPFGRKDLVAHVNELVGRNRCTPASSGEHLR